ncbi:50S ribosomal protein L13 [Candidatus Parcubacteria bacterium]|nr:50S ribosomal protein L13 [Patescibacteria group bacterium]MBU4381122.1 50S ribosomal protein L13 [Patescibacteria group bacterium]MCG2689155.1 50S ribosomal protein L13 [Candidatus Parcubacteria bacterium]
MNKKTYATKKADIKTNWQIIDAKDKVMGRLACEIAEILMGKDKAYFVKNMVVGDKIVVVNALKIKVTGNKEEDKIYVRHSGYMGGLKEETYKNLQKRRPGEVLRRAVAGMLPRNNLRKVWLANLYIYAGDKHPHEGQVKAIVKQ